MNIFRFFGIGAHRILDSGCHVPGIVTNVERCWWLSVKKRAARLYTSSRNTAYAHKVTFSYTVDTIPHQGSLFVGLHYRCPQNGETIEVYYDPEDPKQYACYPFPTETL